MSNNMNKNQFETQPIKQNSNPTNNSLESEISDAQLSHHQEKTDLHGTQSQSIRNFEDSQTSLGYVKDLASQQQFNENLIKLLVLLYQIDNKITLTEQDYFEGLIEKLNWHSGVSISAFINDAIHQARVAIDHGREREFLFSLAQGLNHDPAEAFEHAMNLTAADGKRSDEELEILSLLSNRVLVKGLVA